MNPTIRQYSTYWTALAIVLTFIACAPADGVDEENAAATEATENVSGFNYDGYDQLLKTYVNDEGMVDYKGLKANRKALDAFNQSLAKLRRTEYDSWSESEQIAFWVNAYNSITLQRILDHYPIKKGSLINRLRYPKNSIRQIPGVWKKLTHVVMGKDITLDSIEHEILRVKYKEPRIHAAIVCAAQSCPPLRNEAYRPETLDAQLADNSRDFLSHSDKFRIDREKKRVSISPIFDWFGKDFVGLYNTDNTISGHGKTEGAFLAFISQHVSDNDHKFLIGEEYKVNFQDYDWSLNEQTP